MLHKEGKLTKLERIFFTGEFFIQAAFVISVICFANIVGFSARADIVVMNIGLDCLTLVLTIIMYGSCIRNSSIDKTTFIFLILVMINSVYNYLDALIWLLDGISEYRVYNYILNIFYYFCPILMACTFWFFVSTFGSSAKSEQTKPWTRAILLLSAVAILVIIGNIWGGYFFTVSPDGIYSRTPGTYPVSIIIPTVILLVCTAYIVFQKRIKVWEKITLITYPLLPYLGTLLTLKKDAGSFSTVLLFISLFLIYSNLFVHRERRLAAFEKELAESKVNSLILQINPHFIYNTLGSVSSLCIDDPQKARNMLMTFSDYLRNNFGEMAHKTMIPFSMEIEHLKSYIEIEKQRFPDITVELDMQTTDFELPSLSVQPLVENAITHGIMGREEGGTVKISSSEDDKNFYVTVDDDGMGFETLNKNDGRNHIGVKNVQTRLNMICGGQLDISSTPGVGTSAKIIIPKKGR